MFIPNTTSRDDTVEIDWLAVLVEWVGATTWRRGLAVGLVAGLGLVAATALEAVPSEDRSWSTDASNVESNVVALSGTGVLLAVW